MVWPGAHLAKQPQLPALYCHWEAVGVCVQEERKDSVPMWELQKPGGNGA